jgi:hypothetical protein
MGKKIMKSYFKLGGIFKVFWEKIYTKKLSEDIVEKF